MRGRWYVHANDHQREILKRTDPPPPGLRYRINHFRARELAHLVDCLFGSNSRFLSTDGNQKCMGRVAIERRSCLVGANVTKGRKVKKVRRERESRDAASSALVGVATTYRQHEPAKVELRSTVLERVAN